MYDPNDKTLWCQFSVQQRVRFLAGRCWFDALRFSVLGPVVLSSVHCLEQVAARPEVVGVGS